jgi:hypothetical protein
MAVGRSIKRERERNGAQINASSIRSWRWRAKFLQVFFIFYFLSHTVYFLLLQSKLSPSYFSPLSATQVQVPGNRKPIFFIFVISHVPGVGPNRYFKTVWIYLCTNIFTCIPVHPMSKSNKQQRATQKSVSLRPLNFIPYLHIVRPRALWNLFFPSTGWRALRSFVRSPTKFIGGHYFLVSLPGLG